MLRPRHKQLLLNLLRDRTRSLEDGLRLARATLSADHPSIGRLIEEVRDTQQCVASIEAQPERAAAA